MKMQSLVETLRTKRAEAALGGGEDRIAKQHEKGALTARERLELLLDQGSFHEVDAFKIHRCTDLGQDKTHLPGDGAVTGWGEVDGRTVYVFAQDFTTYAGTLSETVAEKICKIMDMALKVGAPIIALNDSGGARIQEGAAALRGYGDIFYRNVQASGRVPQIATIMGPCAGGAVYSPALMDFIVMVEGTSHMFITGPAVIKTVTGEEVSMDALGGARPQTRTSGVAQFAVKTDQEAIALVRRLVTYLPSSCEEKPPMGPVPDAVPDHTEELLGLLPDNPKKTYDMSKLVGWVMDPGSVLEIAKAYAPNIITAFARAGGQVVGVVANNPRFFAGCLDINASDKGARFVRFCDAFNIPIVTFVDVPGFLPGTQQEYGGIIRHGAKMLYAYSEATVPLVTCIVKKAYGGAYLAMASKHLGADVNLAWPTAEVAVMGPEGAVNIVFKKEIGAAQDKAAEHARLVEDYQTRFASPYVGASRGYIDEVIEPGETRERILSSLKALAGKQGRRLPRRHGNIPL
ncbi:MAG: carboxyl transferase domain-containing protein [Polyangia bacterium]|jgi:acetyl-CoA carboxylase carboxyltransferase component|nr:carboxyl transferase domain-containing protein [Polyangia bacterium]